MRLSLLAFASVLVASSTALHAVPFAPYSNVGQPDLPPRLSSTEQLAPVSPHTSIPSVPLIADTISIFDATTGKDARQCIGAAASLLG